MDALKLFYRDTDLFLNNLFLGGFTTVDIHAAAELDELIKNAADLGLSFLEENLATLGKNLRQIGQAGINTQLLSETVQIFTLLVEYITISQHELSLQEISEGML